MTIRACDRCGADFERRTVARFCPPCRPARDQERQAAYARRRPEVLRAGRRRWRERHPDQVVAIKAAWNAANPERQREHRRAGKRRNPEANRSHVAARKARLRDLTVVPFTAAQLRERLSMFGGRCWMCGRAGDTLDHVKPLAKGGAHMLANLRPACGSCNSRKGVSWPLTTAA
jgi:5-methylcytosine-specific restriction endonuclease McrA